MSGTSESKKAYFVRDSFQWARASYYELDPPMEVNGKDVSFICVIYRFIGSGEIVIEIAHPDSTSKEGYKLCHNIDSKILYDRYITSHKEALAVIGYDMVSPYDDPVRPDLSRRV